MDDFRRVLEYYFLLPTRRDHPITMPRADTRHVDSSDTCAVPLKERVDLCLMQPRALVEVRVDNMTGVACGHMIQMASLFYKDKDCDDYYLYCVDKSHKEAELLPRPPRRRLAFAKPARKMPFKVESLEAMRSRNPDFAGICYPACRFQTELVAIRKPLVDYFVREFGWKPERFMAKLASYPQYTPIYDMANAVPSVEDLARVVEHKTQKCATCGFDVRRKLKHCTRCHVVWYCGKECQRKHWATHKKTCTPSLVPVLEASDAVFDTLCDLIDS